MSKTISFTNGQAIVDVSSELEINGCTRLSSVVFTVIRYVGSSAIVNSAVGDSSTKSITLTARKIDDGSLITASSQVSILIFGY